MSYYTYQGKLIQSNNKYVIGTTGPVGPINRLTSFTNGPSSLFDTFVSSGIDITSAIEAPGTYGKCRSNTYPIVGGFGPFGQLNFIFYLTLNSGNIAVEAYRDGSFQGQYTFSYSGPGDYTVSVLVAQTGNWSVGFASYDTLGLNFSATNCRMYTVDAA